MEVVWQRSKENEKLAEELRKQGLVDGVETDSQSVKLKIDKDLAEIPFESFARAFEKGHRAKAGLGFVERGMAKRLRREVGSNRPFESRFSRGYKGFVFENP